ncbi:MAG: fumarylacetoacetate hydrolase family protein [Firmicutes bacterium]|nr:fumarylacetoacetate hydrolase family protein [Bacillota bacterium]
MYFLTYRYNNKMESGVLSRDRKYVIPFSNIFDSLDAKCPTNMIEFISISDDNLIDSIKRIISSDNVDKILGKSVVICAPIPKPKRNIFCIGKNYQDHVNELKDKTISDSNLPNEPVYFTKSPNCVIANEDYIENHSHITQHLDYEVELAVIIGKKGINISKADAYDYIFGYTIGNDITARNIQKGRNQWFKGKSLDTFCPMGPYIIHKSEIPFPVELDLSCNINGDIRQNSNTSHMIFDISYIISDLSQGIELNPGDIILTGTPSGVGFGFTPPKYLKSKDVVECYIEGIGTLVNIVK